MFQKHEGGATMRIAIVDDIKEERAVLYGWLSNQLSKRNIPGDFVEFESGEEALLEEVILKGIDIFFLDIDLKEKNGIKIAEEIRENNSNAIIIFVSAMNDMIFDSLIVQPFYFIRKDNFDRDMKIACTLIQKYINKNHKIITFDFNGKKTAIQLSDIIYLESFLHEITIHTSSNFYKYSSTFNKMMSLINSTNIVRIHKSYAVNLFWVKEIYKEKLLLRNGVTLKIGKKYQQDVLASYKEYLLK